MAISRLKFWAASLGNLFEHYDAALFSVLSPFIAPLFFPEKDPLTALILTYAMIPLGMLARPLGSLIFGYIGDRFGMGRALFLSLSATAIVSGSVAFCPTYASAGILAPLLLCLARFLQNLLSAGETMGGALILLDDAPIKSRDILSGFYSMTTIGGILLASAGVTFLCKAERLAWGWRGLYLFGCCVAIFGCFLRNKLKHEGEVKISSNLAEIFWKNRKALFQIVLVSGLSYVNYTVALVLTNGFVPLITTFSKIELMGLNTSLLILDLCLLPIFGVLSAKISREKLMLGTSFAIALLAIPLFALLDQATWTTLIFVRVAFVILGVAFHAPFYAWAEQLVPKEHRYSLISFGYALGSQIFGGPAAALSLWLFKKTAIVTSAGWYWTGVALLASLTLRRASLARQPQRA